MFFTIQIDAVTSTLSLLKSSLDVSTCSPLLSTGVNATESVTSLLAPSTGRIASTDAMEDITSSGPYTVTVFILVVTSSTP